MLFIFIQYLLAVKPFESKEDQQAAVFNAISSLVNCYLFLSIQTGYLPNETNKAPSYCIIGNILLNLAFHSSKLLKSLIYDIFEKLKNMKHIYLTNL